MQKQLLLWIMPIVLLLVIATCLVLAPMLISHTAPHWPASNATPNGWYWQI